MVISVHAQTNFNDFQFFEEKMNEVLKDKDQVTLCLYGRNKTEDYSKRYFKNTNVECKNPKLSNFKIQNLYKMIEQSDFSIFFCRDDIRIGSQLTHKSITRARNLGKDFIVFEY